MRTIQRDVVGAFIFSSDDHILLGKAAKGGVYQGAWMIPGGGIEPGESKEQAAIRETLEEVGLDVSNAKMQPIPGTQTGESEKTFKETGERVYVQMTFHDFRFDLSDVAASYPPTPDDDFGHAEWVHISELPNLTLTPGVRGTLQKLGYL